MFVRDWMARRAVLSPDKTAIIKGATGETLSYRQLNERATRLANFLHSEFGVRGGDRIAILAMNRAEVLEAFFAATKLDAILVPLNYRLTHPELQYILEDCEPTVLIYERDCEAMAKQLRTQHDDRHYLSLDDQTGPDRNYESALAEASEAEIAASDFDAEMPALIIYTSGTTGRPKGALLSQRMLTWNSVNTILGWDIVSTDVTTVHTPLFHTGGFNVLTLPLLHIGGTVVILRSFDAVELLEAIEKYHCTVVFAVPMMFQMMLESDRFADTDFQSLRYFISGGAPCPKPLIEAYQRFGVQFTQGYGLTEVGPNCFKLALEDSARKAGSIGFPTFHSEARIIDETGSAVARGEVGELILRGGHVCSGYWQNREATNAALCDGWFYTGDIARQDDEGYYFIVGRAKDMIISGGENIYPAEVEAVLHAHEGVAGAALIGLHDSKWGETPVAVIIMRQGHTATDREIMEFCEGKLARYKIPKRVFFVQEFPLLASGKIMKRVLVKEIEKQVAGERSKV